MSLGFNCSTDSTCNATSSILSSAADLAGDALEISETAVDTVEKPTSFFTIKEFGEFKNHI